MDLAVRCPVATGAGCQGSADEDTQRDQGPISGGLQAETMRGRAKATQIRKPDEDV